MRELSAPIATAVVADRDTTRDALLALIAEEPELAVAGSASSLEDGARLLDMPDVQVILVNLPLSEHLDRPPGIEFIRRAKSLRPDVGILSLKRDIDEHRLRAALDAGADACCLATTSAGRLVQAIKAVAAGATWLDQEISRSLFHPPQAPKAPGGPHISPREREILRLLTDGYTNEEIAERLSCASATVKTHLLHLFRKLGVRDRVSAAVFALRGNLL
ncbi:MAG: response regulator transcription factor [Candidatus Eremiobacteraeota bacterium]|nr:response regulator transcription factor [Candidatus Eremiobacteraeota bacterium]